MTEQIIICDSCKGSGKHEHSECTDYHNNDHDYWDEPCSRCNGTGRLVQQITIRKLTKEELNLRPKPSNYKLFPLQ